MGSVLTMHSCFPCIFFIKAGQKKLRFIIFAIVFGIKAGQKKKLRLLTKISLTNIYATAFKYQVDAFKVDRNQIQLHQQTHSSPPVHSSHHYCSNESDWQQYFPLVFHQDPPCSYATST